jgi:hypothetical protein
MPRFYFHLRDGVDETLDPEGHDMPDMAALRRAVMRNARDVLGGSLTIDGIIDLRYRIDAEDESGKVVYSLPFKHAVSIIPPPRI